MSALRVAGLDISLTGTGVALPDGDCYTIKTRPARGDGRLQDIFDAVSFWAHRLDLAVIEDLPYSARNAGVTGMAQGVVRLALVQAGVRMAFISAATLKKFATGNGRADKPMMAAALIDFYGVDSSGYDLDDGKQYISTPEGGVVTLTEDDQVDAAWLRLAGRTRLGLEPTLQDRAHLLDTGKWEKWTDQ